MDGKDVAGLTGSAAGRLSFIHERAVELSLPDRALAVIIMATANEIDGRHRARCPPIWEWVAMGHREDLIQKSTELLDVIKDMTPSAGTEKWLNENYGPDNATYQELARLARLGVSEGWAANQEVDGPNYRRSRIQEPSAETFHFSITAVYMNSKDARAFTDEHDGDVLRGQFHGHPYGEYNLVIPLDEGAEIKGLWGWQGPGWTAPDPGSRHYPEVKGGALIALFYLPAGRISYDFKDTA